MKSADQMLDVYTTHFHKGKGDRKLKYQIREAMRAYAKDAIDRCEELVATNKSIDELENTFLKVKSELK